MFFCLFKTKLTYLNMYISRSALTGTCVPVGLPKRIILKATMYLLHYTEIYYVLNALKLEGINGKSVEAAFPVLDIANESNAVLIANIISLK